MVFLSHPPLPFFLGPFPAVVGPEIVLRLTTDALLQHLEETVADGVLRHVFRVFGDEHHVCLIVTTAHTHEDAETVLSLYDHFEAGKLIAFGLYGSSKLYTYAQSLGVLRFLASFSKIRLTRLVLPVPSGPKQKRL